MWVREGKKQLRRTLISTISALGSAPWKFTQIVVSPACSSTSQYHT